MNDLYILTKQEFTSLYRFGQIPLNQKKIINLESLTEEDLENKIFKTFMSIPYFVGDEEYLIIRFENKLINEIWLEIEKVSEIIPLTEAAKNSYQMKFDSKLDFGQPQFESIVRKVEEETDINEMFRGAKTFWALCKVEDEYKGFLKNEIIKSAYCKRVKGIKSSEFKQDFFIHLLAYDRYEFFPNTDLGFFYDIGEIFAHSKGAPSFKGSGFHSFLEKNKQEFTQKSFLELIDIISKSNEITKFTEQLTTENLKKYIVAAIFLKFKADLSDRDTIKSSDTGQLVGEFSKLEEYSNELNFAIYLTGLFFGYKKFYDDYYELIDLKIFKKPVSKKDSKDSSEDSSGEIEKNPKKSGTENNEDEAKRDEPLKSIDSNDKISSEDSGIQKQVLNQIIDMLDKVEDHSFEIKIDALKELKKILKPLNKGENIGTKEQVVSIIRGKFNDTISIEQKGKSKYIISFKTDLQRKLEKST